MNLRQLLKVLHAPDYAKVKLFFDDSLYHFEFGDMQMVIYLSNNTIEKNEDFKLIKQFLDFKVESFSILSFECYDITLKSDIFI